MSQFKVGDKVKGVGRKYGITNEKMRLGLVVKVHEKPKWNDEDIRVKVLDHDCMQSQIGHEYDVNSNYFELVEPKKTEPIVIYGKGSEVIALDKNTGKRAIARCNPCDSFDFMTGAKLAFERLTGSDATEPKEKKCFKVRCIRFRGKERYFTKGKVYKVHVDKYGQSLRSDTDFVYKQDDVIEFLSTWYEFEKVADDAEDECYLNCKICVTDFDGSGLTVGKIYEIKDGMFKSDDGSEYPLGEPIRDIKDLKLYFRVKRGDGKRGKHFDSNPVKFVVVVE